jgi:hypothetical protein
MQNPLGEPGTKNAAVVVVVVWREQHLPRLHLPSTQNGFPGLVTNPVGHAKESAQYTLVVVVVVVVGLTVQHLAWLHSPATQNGLLPSTDLSSKPAGQLKDAQVALGEQHLPRLHSSFTQNGLPGLASKPVGHVKESQ